MAGPLIINSLLNSCSGKRPSDDIMTVNGRIKPQGLGFSLTHEHVLVDFSGAADYNPNRWDQDDVVRVVSPYIKEIMDMGCKSLIECTPEYIGRDPVLLRRIADQTGMIFLTNTGFYGAADNKYMPDAGYDLSAEALAEIWIGEFESGIKDTGIKPGFLKIGVATGSLSDLHRKIVTAAAKTHLETGMVIASHTGPAIPAYEEMEILKALNISPEAFVWVHAQNEKEQSLRVKAAKMGAWVSIDGLNKENTDQYVAWLEDFKQQQVLNKVLVSHDAGWYTPGEEDGGSFTPFTPVFTDLIPALENAGFNASEIEQVFVKNPADAFTLKIRKIT